MDKRVNLKITGKVQGVFFRHNSKEIADSLNLTGYVQNNPDNTVTIVAEGEENDLKEFVKFIQKGTPQSKIENIKTDWQAPTNEFKQFEVKF